jgi:predicted nucleic acid-binding Zn ribbon protein
MVPAHTAIPRVLAEVLRKAPMCPEKVDFAWRAAVGPAVARITKVSLAADGVLHVTSSEAHWTTEVRRSSKLIMARLEGLLGPGTVKKIRSTG